MKKLISIFFLLCGLSCKKAFLYSPNEVTLSPSEQNLNHQNIQRIQSASGTGSFKFIVIGDSQRFYDELEAFVASVNQRSDISFVILNGDISDFGLVREFRWVNERLERLNVPYVAVIGNHDMLANGKIIFNRMFGPDNYSFSFNRNKFICLNTNSREAGFNGSLPDTSWLGSELKSLDTCENAFVIGHVPPFSSDFDQSLADSYAASLAATNKIPLSIYSHTHHYSLSNPYGNEVTYLVTASMNRKNYVIVSVNNETYSIEKVYY